ncbi:MAG: type VI secretion system tip protein TssI/VgrG [Pseudomonadota bacterium]|nr:type VI secretion system tip protein TssI/VgrG [Pseudomonadota bacterium]
MKQSANHARFLFRIPRLSVELRVVGFELTAAISRPYRCQVEFACEDPALDLDKLLGKAAILTLADQSHPQYLHGEITRLEQGPSGKRFTRYHATLEPKLAWLRWRQDFRIFQQQTVPAIISTVLQDAGLTADDMEFALTRDYPAREYCTQYRETDFDFVSRLLEEEGLFYLFQQRPDGQVLVICDHQNGFKPIDGDPVLGYKPPTGMTPTHESVHRLHLNHSIQPDRVTLRDYHWPKTRLRLEASARGKDHPELEQYHYRGNVSNPAAGTRYARLRHEAHQAQAETVTGAADSPRLWPGRRVSFHSHPYRDLNIETTLTAVNMRGRQPQALEEDAPDEASRFSCEFTAIPVNVPYRPLLQTEPPRIEGTQTAFVTGPPGEEIYTDKMGRVKVQFHWDRDGRANERSSCWLRVSQALAGNQWGALVIPRVGQEVIVAFLEGNPDRPVITGTLYNGASNPPHSLPKHQTRTTFKTHSSPGGEGFNELRLDDKKDREQIYVHAQRDLDLHANHDWRESIGSQLHQTVGRNMHQTIGGDAHTRIKQHRSLKVAGDHAQQVGQNAELKIAGSYIEEAGQDIALKAGTELVIEAGVELTLKSGGSLVKLDPSGITVKGPTVRINSGGAASVAPNPVTPAPQEATAADQGGKPGQASAPAMTNQVPVMKTENRGKIEGAIVSPRSKAGSSATVGSEPEKERRSRPRRRELQGAVGDVEKSDVADNKAIMPDEIVSVSNSTPNVNLIGDTSGFNALGIAVDPKASQQGRLLMKQYRQQYPDMTPVEIQRLARSTLETGDTLPNVSVAKPGDTFYKLIPTSETRGPSPGTVYWMDGYQLDELMADKIDIGSSFGLPNQTTASTYKVYQTSVKEAQAPLIFRSNIAPVVDDGIFKTGGQNQTLLPKRAAFSEPVQILDGNGNPLIIRSR